MKKLILSIILLFTAMDAFCQIKTVTAKEAYILSDYNGDEFAKNKKIKAGSEIIVYKEFEKSSSFYEIEYKGRKWCIKRDAISSSDEIKTLFKEADKRIKDAKETEKKIDMKEWGEKWERGSYGKWYNHVKRKEIAIGMTERIFKAILGEPKDVFVSEYSSYTFKRYTYSNIYIDTENGAIESFHYTE